MSAPERILWATYRVKGAYYYRDTYAYREMSRDFYHGKLINLTLEREPTNVHDSRAIKVLAPDGHTLIGYVGKEVNTQLGLWMDNFGMRISAELAGFSDFNTHQLHMHVYLHREAPKPVKTIRSIHDELAPYVSKPVQNTDHVLLDEMAGGNSNVQIKPQPIYDDFL